MRGSGVLASDGGSDFRSGGRKAVLAGETGRGLGVQKRDAGQMSHIIAAFPYYLEDKGLPVLHVGVMHSVIYLQLKLAHTA